jgi:hypothetical protein
MVAAAEEAQSLCAEEDATPASAGGQKNKELCQENNGGRDFPMFIFGLRLSFCHALPDGVRSTSAPHPGVCFSDAPSTPLRARGIFPWCPRCMTACPSDGFPDEVIILADRQSRLWFELQECYSASRTIPRPRVKEAVLTSSAEFVTTI